MTEREKLGCFGQTWNLFWFVYLILSILFSWWTFNLSEEPYLLRMGAVFAITTSAIGTVYQVYKKKPDGFLNAIKHEFFITRKYISGSATWIVNRVREIVEEITQKQTEDIKSHIDRKHEKGLPVSLVSASQAVKNAYIALDSVDIAQRRGAISTLLESADPNATAALEFAVSHSTPSVRIDAALALAEKTEGKNEYALSGLLEALDVEDVDTKDRALKSIWSIFQEIPSSVSKRPIEKLIDALGDINVDIRWTAEHVLINQCDKTLSYLIEAISHDFSSIQIAALEAIWIISDNYTLPHQQLLSAVPALIEALEDHDQGVTPRDKEYTCVSKLAEKILIVLSPAEELSAYLQNDRTWMHQHVSRVLQRVQDPDPDD